MFVTIICASVILATSGLANIGLAGIGLAHAFGLGATITIFAAVSGSHFNPAVTLSAWIGRKISSADALGYVACQILGALGAGVVLRVMFSEAAWRTSNLGTPGLSVSSGKGLLVEAVLTFFLCLAVWGTGLDERGPKVNGFFIGITLGAMVIAFGPLTGVGLNPARYLGPAAVAGHVDDWWVYFLGPAIGALVAGVMYPTLFQGGFPWMRREEPDELPAPVPVPAEPDEPTDVAARAVRRPAKRKPAARKPRA
jgi:MIP family channel proteins